MWPNKRPIDEMQKTSPNQDQSKQAKLMVFFNNPNYSDVKLIVGSEHEPGSQVTFLGHKLLLAANSPVFHAMFQSDIPIQDNEVRIIDVQPRIFELFMKFVYRQDEPEKALALVKPNPDAIELADLIQLAYVSTKYLVEDLAKYFSDKILQSLTSNYKGQCELRADNALGIWKMMREWIPGSSAAKLVDKYIERNAAEILRRKEFMNLDNDSLTKFLEIDSLNVKKEMDLFEALCAWTTIRCLEELSPTHAKQLRKKPPAHIFSYFCFWIRGSQSLAARMREVMGPALFQIRFPGMDFYSFCSEVGSYEILSDEEMNDIVDFMMTSLMSRPTTKLCPPFNVKPRPSTLDGLEGAKDRALNYDPSYH